MGQCPNKCGPLSRSTYDKVEIEACNRSRGMWLSHGKLTEIIRTKEREWPAATVQKVLGDLRRFNAPPRGEDRDLRCPECTSRLEEVNYQGTSNIIVNPCPRYHGVWLDFGELRAIQIFMQYWAKYAEDHGPELQEQLKSVGHRYAQMRESLIDRGPSSSRAMNELIYEALELLDRGRA